MDGFARTGIGGAPTSRDPTIIRRDRSVMGLFRSSMQPAARPEVLHLHVHLLGGRAVGPWFQRTQIPEKGIEHEKKTGAPAKSRATPRPAYPEAHGGKIRTPGHAGKILGPFRQGNATPHAASCNPALEPFRHATCASRTSTNILRRMRQPGRANRRCSCTAVLAPVPTSARDVFDPQPYRIVVFDRSAVGAAVQARASSRIRPGILVADIERLRKHLGIERWLVFGDRGQHLGHWLMRRQIPERVSEFVLRGIFLLRYAEISVLTSTAASVYFPMRGRRTATRSRPTNR